MARCYNEQNQKARCYTEEIYHMQESTVQGLGKGVGGKQLVCGGGAGGAGKAYRGSVCFLREAGEAFGRVVGTHVEDAELRLQRGCHQLVHLYPPRTSSHKANRATEVDN